MNKVIKEDRIKIAFAIMATVPFIFLAWMNDDAFITFRTVDNFVRGYGLTWNPIERVQSYTHPLWLLLLLPLSLIQKDIYLNCIGLSLLLNCALFYLFLKLGRAGPFLVVTLFGAKCFQDYGISGLENPLLHTLLVLFISATYQRRYRTAILWASFGYLTRQDSILISAPCLAYLSVVNYRTVGFKPTLKSIVLGASPVILWSLFSLTYYGFIFPNTAYAKLATGIPPQPLIGAGLNYLKNSLLWDPLTLLTIFCSAVFIALRGKATERLVTIGIFLYLIYVVKVGGDYMSGRFLSAPFIVMIYLAGKHLNARLATTIAVSALILALINPRSFFSPLPLPEKIFDKARIADSRRSFAPDTALITYIKNNRSIHSRYYLKGIWMRNQQRLVFKSKAIGMEGFAAGPTKTIVDIYGLSDPLLARLPVLDPTRWRVGHYARKVPVGYEAAILKGPAELESGALRDYYAAIYTITRAPIFSSERLRVLLNFHLGRYETFRQSYLAEQR